LKAAGTPSGPDRYLLPPTAAAGEWMPLFAAAAVITIAYLLAARLGLALLSAHSDVAVFWPASGLAAGILITFGPRARPALIIGVVVGTVTAGLMSDRGLITSIFNGSWNAGEAVLAAWLLERHFGQPFTFADLRRVVGFLVAAGLACAASAVGGATTMTLLHPETTAPYWDVWREWFLSSWVGLVVVAPLVIGMAQTWRKPPSQEEWIEGLGVLSLTVVACSFTMAQKTGSWLSFSPGALVLPLLLWLTARCQPTFAIAGAFLASVAIICATTFGIGRFGDAAVPIMQRVTGAQLAMMTITLFTLVLAVLFAQRKKAEEALRQSEGQLAKERTMLARLHEVGSRLWLKRDLRQALDEILAGAIELLNADMGTIRILDTTRGVLKIEAQRGFTQEYLDCFGEISADGDLPCCTALRSAERIIIADVEVDDVFTPFRGTVRATGYRAVQSTPIMSHDGVRLGTLATHFRSTQNPSHQDLRLLDLYVRQAADIIERHKGEDALRESEERLRLAQLKTGISVWDRDLRTGKVTLTPELEALLGLKPGSMKCYEDFRAQVHPDDISAYEAARNEAVRRRSTFEVEYRIIRPDGQVRWMVTRGGAIYDDETGEPIRLVGNDADITERKMAELALAERNTQLELASKTARVGTFVIEFQTGLVKLSPGGASILGLPESATEISREEGLSLVHPEDLPGLELQRDQALLKQQREFVARYRIRRANDGEVRFMEIRGLNFYGRDGQPSRTIVVIIDFTERKLAAQTLAERDLQLALAGRASLVGSYAYDTATEMLQVSEGYAAVHGFPEGTTKIPRNQWLAGVHPEDVKWLEKCRSQAFRQRRAEYSVDYRVLLPGRELRRIEARCFITYDGDEHPQRVVGVIIDVTERRRTEKALAERKAQLELANNIAQVGSYTYDYTTRTLWLGPGSASIYGLQENAVAMTADEWRKCLHPKDLPHLVARSRQALANLQPELVCVFRVLRRGEVRWIETRNRFFYDRAGRATQAIGVSIDITERRRDEDLKSLLIAELDHRVKNTLATVKAVVSHTSEGSRSVANFVVALEGRIRSMATTHELLSARRWQGVLLAELVCRELAPYSTDNNTEINGPEVVLKPEAGQAMAMVLHELATNAAKYGALSTKEGRVSIRWDRRLNGHPPHLVLEWQESGGPPLIAPGKPNFGTSTIRDLIPYEFGGMVDLVLAAGGVRCRLELPADWLSDDGLPVSEAIADVSMRTGEI
jgi:PAS domain S-box-containing protein